jgi:AcrR family transcriptional regulator
MARQTRSEATRRKLLDAAIEVFGEAGYAAAGRNEIVERAGMTKGALYHHFDSMESLASAIIDEGSDTVFTVFQNICQPSSPAFEAMIHGTFAAAGVLVSNNTALVAEQLSLALGPFNETAANFFTRWVEAMALQAKRAVAEGDLKEELDPQTVGELIAAAVFGTRLLITTMPDSDPIGRLRRMWEMLLPVIAADATLPYFREFLAREMLRHLPSALTPVPK